jgi:hypothetical protein
MFAFRLSTPASENAECTHSAFRTPHSAFSKEKDYSSWPDRLYVVDQDGKVAYKGGPGPQGFDSTELGVFLELHLPKGKAK